MFDTDTAVSELRVCLILTNTTFSEFNRNKVDISIKLLILVHDDDKTIDGPDNSKPTGHLDLNANY